MKKTKHLGGWRELDSHTHMPDIWEELIRRFSIGSVLDIGCGAGATAAWFKEHDCRVLGIDGDPTVLDKDRVPEITIHDYAFGPFVPEGQWDLAWSAEFVEHLHEGYIDNFMATFKAASLVCITHANPGQRGHHHVNCRSDNYWVGEFSKRGFLLDLETTEWMRSTKQRKTRYGRNTLMLFRNLTGDKP